ncbi:MAG: 3-hydroxyacyl-CoA dehydrogenase [Gammaproteobacteria bacterium]|jgi:3-hydroxyacyl-CoA dehydrogenase
MSATINYSVIGNVAVLTIDNPPVNALSQTVRQELINLVHRLNEDSSVEAAILICAGRTFIAGADISEFNKPPLDPLLPDVIAELEASNKIIVAAIHGTALGGGFEVAMASHYRCALSTAKVGLPEVNLGLLPGATGTQRLPRLVGIERALELLTTGKHIVAGEAVEYGAIDKLIMGDLLEGALEYTHELISKGARPRRLSELALDTVGLDKNFFKDFRQRIEHKYRGYFSPQKIVECVEAGVSMSYTDAIKFERQSFNECKASSHSKALRYLFFAERQASKIPGIDKQTPRRKIQRVAIIGLGTMGSGITLNFLNAGIAVLVLDKDEASLERGLMLIRSQLEDEVKKGHITDEDLNEKLGLLTTTLEYSHLREIDLVIESGFEDLTIKREIFSKLDVECKSGVILATNTSTLDINDIARQTQRAEDVIGMHFFAPANRMKLLEIVRTENTSDEVLATTLDLAKTLKKTAVVVGVCFGFVGNRMFLPYLREAQLMVLEGVSPARIDKLAYDWGMAMGPFAVMDMSGLDVFFRIYKQFDDMTNKYCYFPLSNVLYEMGRLGIKSKVGFFKYQGQESVENPELAEIAQRHAEQNHIIRREISDDEIIQRLMFAMINEGALILEQGIAQRPGDIDVIFTNGFGFPRYRGGPMCYADMVGIVNVYEGVCKLRQQYGEALWTPSVLLQDLAEKGESFTKLS